MLKKILSKLPPEADAQIEIYCADEGKDVSELTKEEVIEEIQWTIERMKMDLSEFHPTEKELIKEAKKTIVECERILKRLDALP